MIASDGCIAFDAPEEPGVRFALASSDENTRPVLLISEI
jgi:hypothetical protein